MEEHKAKEVEFVKVKSSVAFGLNTYMDYGGMYVSLMIFHYIPALMWNTLLSWILPWNYNKEKENMYEHPLFHAQLSLRLEYCWKYFEILFNIFDSSQVYEIHNFDWPMEMNFYELSNRISWFR